MRQYPVYKGLQSPLSFRGFRGKFIAWGAACVALSLLLAGVLGASLGMFLGCSSLVVSLPASLYFISNRQKNGLHSKTRYKGIYIPGAKIFYNYGTKT